MNYREKRSAYLNCEKRIFSGTGPFDFPMMDPVEVDVENTEAIGFNYVIGCRHPEDKIVHFYLDDYQFERVWNDPNRYVPLLSKFKAVFSPDFSLYIDFPKAVQIFNHYRKQWCSAYWQEHGIKVIPSICWSDEESFDWCFDGVPKHSLISISSIGGFGNHSEHNKELWLTGYEKCLEVLEPSQVILFGKMHPEIREHENMTIISNDQLVRKKTLSTNNSGDTLILVTTDTEKLEG